MLPMSKVDLFAAIRRDARAGMSVRAMAGKYQVSRRNGPSGAAVGVAPTPQGDAAAGVEA
jgi:hypothetical protein